MWHVAGTLVVVASRYVGWLYPLDGEGRLCEIGREYHAAAALGVRRDGRLGVEFQYSSGS